MGGKITVGLTDFSLTTYELKVYEREMSTPPMLQCSMAPFTFYNKSSFGSLKTHSVQNTR